jgi:hypothetical protein
MKALFYDNRSPFSPTTRWRWRSLCLSRKPLHPQNRPSIAKHDRKAIDFPLLSTFSLLTSLFFNPPFCRDSHQFPMFSMGLHSTPVGMIAKSENTESIDDLLNPTTGSDDENSHGFSIPSEIERMGSSNIHHG